MDYGRMIKQAWAIAWRYKILWVFGLFVGGGFSGGSSNWSGDLGGTEFSRFGLDPYQLERTVERNLPIILAAAAFLVLFAIFMIVIGVAARGGLIYLVNEAAEGREVRGGAGWAVGFRMWLRVFGIGFVLYVPFIVVALVLLFVAFVPLFAVTGGTETALGGVFSLCCGISVAAVLLLLGGFVAGLLEALATRHAVIDDVGVFASIGRAWSALRSRFKDVFLMWLVLLGIGIAVGIAFGVVVVMFGLGAIASIRGGALFVAVAIGFVLFLVMLVPSAIYGTFVSALWTVFFRSLTGRDTVAAPAAPAQSPYGTGYPPPPPTHSAQQDAPLPGYIPAPPAPPAPPVPPAPPTNGSPGDGVPPAPE